ncbi:MAG: hypothetical protein COU31_01300 [Candidatus Magasanikbacteria bacterium CG10_big_fil_rev_8_21_14_0_10_40_10]|uniref:Uncharacterized protein n=1 Tax=Candidatus Magasanikbacteria bacterium CG10_big_fil_rev_8_21_14_0_10_40_10 TaxID=1974648 RepID=A0A2M6W4K5_9BACT|nr:MAG: hypothetical protein COU31_01300 [Candidatus Magasanikbacteria bacterium CG10_big_fil_rev_8_21_14_0_10_40_10]
MMDLKLNLLPPDKKNRLKNLISFIFSKHILEIILIGCCVIAMALIWSWVVLQEGFSELIASSYSVNKEYLSYNQEIKKINIHINGVQKASQNFWPTLPYITQIAQNLPADIKLTALYCDFDNKKMELQGVAKTRDDLVNYQEKLKEISWLGETNTPLSKLFQKNDISFEFKTSLKTP